jgi:hypothetical protein
MIGRRTLFKAVGLGVAFTTAAGVVASATEAAPGPADLVPKDGDALRQLMGRLAKAPRRRDFKTVPMILTDPDQWDNQAIEDLKAYKASTKQVCDNKALDGPWLNLMRNMLNTETISFKHPDFLIVSATHASAHFALYDETIWEKYQITKLAGDKFKTNTAIVEKKGASSDPSDFQSATGIFSPDNISIPALMRRGAVFMGCHNAIWEQARILISKDLNPDKLSQEALTAELSNHLIPGAILTPGVIATLLELQKSGFEYAT